MTEIIKPFLASKITDYSKLKYPLWMSPKLEGGYVMTEQPKEIVSLDYYKTNVGIFLRNMWGASYNGYNGTPYLNNYKFNGQCFPNILRGGNFFLLLRYTFFKFWNLSCIMNCIFYRFYAL